MWISQNITQFDKKEIFRKMQTFLSQLAPQAHQTTPFYATIFDFQVFCNLNFSATEISKYPLSSYWRALVVDFLGSVLLPDPTVRRFLYQNFQHIIWIAFVAWSVEVLGPTRRSVSGALTHVFYSFGYMASSGLGWLLPGLKAHIKAKRRFKCKVESEG